MKLGIIVPCFNEEANIIRIYDELSKVLNSTNYIANYDILYIDDGSTDSTIIKIKEIAKKHEEVMYLKLSRNFGKEAALYAGMKEMVGLNYDYIGIIDADLQDPPELMEKMLLILSTRPECDCVAAKRKSRSGENPIRSVFSRMFYKVINIMSDVHIEPNARDYRIMRLSMARSIIEVSEKTRFSKGIFSWVGYETEWLEYENVIRKNGKSKWSFWSLCKYAIDGIVSFSVIPLTLSSYIGGVVCLGSVFGFIYILIQKLVAGIDIEGYALLVCSIFLLGGVQLLCVGIIGKYIEKIYIEAKSRPMYFIKEQTVKNAKQGCDD